MVRKARQASHRRKGISTVSRDERAAKDEKARYERFRRRRWGIIKKISEYVEKFDAQACVLVSDRYQTHYFTSGEWVREPERIPGVIRVFGPGRRDLRRRGSMSSEASYETASDQPDLRLIQGLSTTYAASLSGLRNVLSRMVKTIEALQVKNTLDA